MVEGGGAGRGGFPTLKFDAQTIEGFGRKLFATQKGASADKLPQLANDIAVPTGNFWAERCVFSRSVAPWRFIPVQLAILSTAPVTA